MSHLNCPGCNKELPMDNAYRYCWDCLDKIVEKDLKDKANKNQPEELHQALQCRDALQMLCDRGYDLQDLLTICEKEIEVLTQQIQGGQS